MTVGPRVPAGLQHKRLKLTQLMGCSCARYNMQVARECMGQLAFCATTAAEGWSELAQLLGRHGALLTLASETDFCVTTRAVSALIPTFAPMLTYERERR
jgi:hypothetical protein